MTGFRRVSSGKSTTKQHSCVTCWSEKKLKGVTVVNDFVPRPREDYDPHWVIKRDIRKIIEKYTAKGDIETVAIYQQALARFSE